MPLRICYLIDHLGPGGAQEILLGLVERRSPGIEAKVYSLRDRTLPEVARRLAAAQVEHRSLAVRGLDPTALLRLGRWLAGDAPDLLHTFLNVSNSVGPIIAPGIRRPRAPLVRHIDNDPYQHYHWTTRCGLRILGPGVALHIAVSSELGATLRRLLPRANIAVVPPGIDLERFVSAARANERAPQSSASPHRPGSRPATIGTVARLTEQKGIDTLLQSALLVRAEAPDLRVLIAGEGPVRADLEAQAGRLGLADAVRFLGHVEDVRAVYRDLDVFVLASRHEGSPLALLEAMAMGVPVVATRVSGLAEVVRHGTTGVLVEPEQPRGLADAVVDLLADADLRRSLADAAHRWVCAERSVEAMTRKIESIYASIASAPTR